MKSIAIIGGGNLGVALAEGILSNSIVKPENLYVTRNQIEKIRFLADKGIRVTKENLLAAEKGDVIILAVKPYKVLEILEEIKPKLGFGKIVVSVATGVDINSMQNVVGNELTIYRAMPNTAASVSESLTCICGNSIQGMEEVKSIFNAIGKTVRSEEHTSELQSRENLVCRLLLEKK